MFLLKLFIPAIIACSCNALANMFWKMRFDQVPLKLGSAEDIIGLATSLHIWSGVGCYVISMVIFFYMLSNFKLSVVTPVTCMTYIFNVVIARIVFHEKITSIQIIGIAIVIIGLIILSRAKEI